jgi:hypothetical protein
MTRDLVTARDSADDRGSAVSVTRYLQAGTHDAFQRTRQTGEEFTCIDMSHDWQQVS